MLHAAPDRGAVFAGGPRRSHRPSLLDHQSQEATGEKESLPPVDQVHPVTMMQSDLVGAKFEKRPVRGWWV